MPPVERELREEETEEERARRKEQAARKRRERALAKDAVLETEEVEHPVPEEDKRCPRCGGADFTHFGFEQTVTYEYVPGRFVRRVHKLEKVRCRCASCILTASPPPKPIAGGRYGAGFIAFLIVEKCADSIPIYRIEKRMHRLGIPISRSTMNDLLHAGAEVLRPLAVRIRARVRGTEIVLADETSMRLQDREKRGYVWVFHGLDDRTGTELVLYVFSADRSGDTPARILGGTEGTLVVDGYTGYNEVTDPEGRARGGCWARARRKLYEAMLGGEPDATEAIDQIRGLFRVEHEALLRGIVRTDAHLALRIQKAGPIIDELHEWVKAKRTEHLPKSQFGQALGYVERQWPRLTLFLTDARIPLHNTASERRLRDVALGRKNYLFFGHPRAGRNFATLYSLVASCIANEVEPTAYLADVLPRVQTATTDDELDALLPDRWSPLTPCGP